MKYRYAFLGLGIFLPVLLLAGILWYDSEQQYVAMTNLGRRLKVLQQSGLVANQPGQKNGRPWKMVWKPMLTAMQYEARHAAMRPKGLHLSQAMYEQLSRFSEENIGDEADLRKVLSRLKFPDESLEAKAPIVLGTKEQAYSLATLAEFHKETAAILASENAYSDWLTPILQQQRLLDRTTTCKTLKEMKAFQVYGDRLRSKCATETEKWAVCGRKDEPIARQMQELQLSLESNFRKFKSRWPVDNVNDLCADF